LFFLFIKIKIAIVSKKIFAFLIIKARNLVVLIALNNLKFKENNLNIKFRNRNSKEDFFLKNFNSLFSFL